MKRLALVLFLVLALSGGMVFAQSTSTTIVFYDDVVSIKIKREMSVCASPDGPCTLSTVTGPIGVDPDGNPGFVTIKFFNFDGATNPVVTNLHLHGWVLNDPHDGGNSSSRDWLCTSFPYPPGSGLSSFFGTTDTWVPDKVSTEKIHTIMPCNIFKDDVLHGHGFAEFIATVKEKADIKGGPNDYALDTITATLELWGGTGKVVSTGKTSLQLTEQCLEGDTNPPCIPYLADSLPSYPLQ